jgi:hypothetical protein
LYIYKVLKQVHTDTGISNKAVAYSSYIYKVINWQVHPDTGISNKAMTLLNTFIFKPLIP